MAESAASRVATELKELRESHWPDARLTQAHLAKAFGVSSATVSSWESDTNPKTPPDGRLRAYARFFATQRSLTAGLIPEDELEADELEEFHNLEERLLGLLRRREPASSAHRTFTFAEGPVTVICPEAPREER